MMWYPVSYILNHPSIAPNPHPLPKVAATPASEPGNPQSPKSRKKKKYFEIDQPAEIFLGNRRLVLKQNTTY